MSLHLSGAYSNDAALYREPPHTHSILPEIQALMSSWQVSRMLMRSYHSSHHRLEKATIDTIEAGEMTKDLALITTIENPTVLNSEQFIKAIAKRL